MPNPTACLNLFEYWFPMPGCPALITCLPPPSQDEGPRDTVDRKVSDLEFSEAELVGEEGV